MWEKSGRIVARFLPTLAELWRSPFAAFVTWPLDRGSFQKHIFGKGRKPPRPALPPICACARAVAGSQLGVGTGTRCWPVSSRLATAANNIIALRPRAHFRGVYINQLKQKSMTRTDPDDVLTCSPAAAASLLEATLCPVRPSTNLSCSDFLGFRPCPACLRPRGGAKS